MPPSLSPSAATAARWSPGRIVERTERPRRAFVAAIRREPKQQLGARPAREAVVVGGLEPEAGVALGGRAAGDRRRGGLAIQAPAVGGEHGGALRARADRAPHALARAQAGQPQVRAPAHAHALARARDRQRDPPAQRPEQLRAHGDRERDLAVDGLAPAPDHDLLHRRLGVGGGVVGGEALGRVLRARVGVELGEHRGGPALLPRGREAHGGVAQLGAVGLALVQHVGDGAARGEQQHEDHDREHGQLAAPPAAGLDPAHAAPAAAAARGGEHLALTAARQLGHGLEEREERRAPAARRRRSAGSGRSPRSVSISARPPASR